MSSKDAEASFRISIDGNAASVSKEISSSARLATKAIGEYEAEVKALSGDLRRLKGNSEEVNTTKAALKKRIDEAKTSVSQLSVELAKQGTTYAAASAAAKKYGDGVGKLPNLRKAASKAIQAAGKAIDPAAQKLGKTLEPLKAKLSAAFAPIGKKIAASLGPAGSKLGKFGATAKQALSGLGKAAAEDAGSVLPSLGTALGVVASGAALAVAAIAAVGVAAVAAGAAVVAFGIKSADAAAKMQRQREALLGNATDAKNLGDQINALAATVPQGVAELNELGRELSKTRLSGGAIVNTMKAVAQATGAVDASAGSKIQELLTRTQNTGRFFLGQLELQGTGIDFDDVAKEYAAGTKKSIAAARKELLNGQVTLDAGAEALAKATEKKFGKLNLANAFSLENAPTKFFDQLHDLTKGVDLSPITKGLQDAFGQLSPEAPLGGGIKTFMETVGTGFADVAGKSIPILLEGFKWLVVGALRVVTVFYETKKAVKDAFETGDWIGIGKAIVNGLVRGIEVEGPTAIFKAVSGMAKNVKKAFTGDLEIHSPSRVFARYGENTAEGYAQGVERGSKRATGAVQSMVQMPEAGGGRTAPSVGTLEVHFHGAPTGDASAMQSPAFLASVTRAVRDAVTAQAVAA